MNEKIPTYTIKTTSELEPSEYQLNVNRTTNQIKPSARKGSQIRPQFTRQLPRDPSLGEPNSVWFLPTDCIVKYFLDQKGSNLRNWEKQTGTRLNYVHEQRKVEIWGNETQINYAERLFEAESTRSKKNTRIGKSARDWAKPTKPLTEQEELKLKKKNEKEQRLEYLRGEPSKTHKYTTYIMLIDQNMHEVQKRFGKELIDFDKLRLQSKCNIWLEKEEKSIVVSSSDKDATLKVAERIKCINIARLAEYKKTNSLSILLNSENITKVEIKKEDKITKQVETKEDVIVMKPKFIKTNTNSKPKIDKEAILKIEQNIGSWLRILKPFRGLIRIHALIGHVYFPTNISLKDVTYDLEYFTKNILENEKYVSDFSKCAAGKEVNFSKLITYLNTNLTEFLYNTKTYYTIHAKTTARSTLPSNIKIEFQIYESTGEVTSYQVYGKGNELGKNNIFLPNNNFDCKVALDVHAIYDNTNPELDLFIKAINCKEDIKYQDTNNIKVEKIVKKTTYKHSFKENLILETTKNNIWYNKNNTNFKKQYIILDQNKSHDCVSFKAYYENWTEKLIKNKMLKIGEISRWNLEDIFDHSICENFVTEVVALIDVLEKYFDQ